MDGEDVKAEGHAHQRQGDRSGTPAVQADGREAEGQRDRHPPHRPWFETKGARRIAGGEDEECRCREGEDGAQDDAAALPLPRESGESETADDEGKHGEDDQARRKPPLHPKPRENEGSWIGGGRCFELQLEVARSAERGLHLDRLRAQRDMRYPVGPAMSTSGFSPATRGARVNRPDPAARRARADEPANFVAPMKPPVSFWSWKPARTFRQSPFRSTENPGQARNTAAASPASAMARRDLAIIRPSGPRDTEASGSRC